jgi:autotransporter passenger strand-loop-strand repeat protein
VLIDAGNAGTFTYDTTLASGTQLTSVSTEFVLAGGIASANTVSDSTQVVFSGGQTVSTTLGVYGFEALYDAKAIGTVVGQSGSIDVFSGSVASGTVISAGGVELVLYGGTAGNTTLAGGTLSISSGGITSGSIDFTSGGGNLVVSSLVAMPAAVISGFAAGDDVTLASLPYSATYSAVVKTAGVVTISAGTKTYALNISGAVVGETNFTLTSASGGGTALGLSGALGAAVHMNFLAPTTAAGIAPDTRQAFALDAATLHQQTIGRVNSAAPAPHAASAYLAGSIPDLLAIARGGAQSLTLHAPHFQA